MKLKNQKSPGEKKKTEKKSLFLIWERQFWGKKTKTLSNIAIICSNGFLLYF